MVEIKVPKNLVLNGTDNNGFRHRYSFDKTKDFKKSFLSFMGSLGFDKGKINDKFIVRTYEDDDNEGETEKVFIKEVFDLVDVIWFFQNEKFEVDVFFGKDKVIILVRTKDNKKTREKLVDELERKSKWISEEEKEKRLKKNKQVSESKLKIPN
ncbi:MAG: hypothetical protein PVJ67_02410 [Candidatus Pacearchaeota archaeon]|jgi:hypothetical protein